MADVGNQEQVHQEGVDHVKDQVFNNNNDGTATSTTKPDPIVPAKPPASNPGADDPTGGMAKDAGGVSGSAHVEPPTAASNQESKSIVGQLKGLFLGGDKKEREVSEAGSARHGSTTTGAVAAGVTGTGLATVTSPPGARAVAADTAGSGPAVAQPGEKTYLNYGNGQKDSAASSMPPSRTTEPVKESDLADSSKANTGATAASTGGPNTDTSEPGNTPAPDSKVEDTPAETSGEDGHKPPAPAGGKPSENREAIPTAGGKKLGEEHWGESKIVPDNPKPAGVASGDGQPTSEVKDNTAKNTGGATGGPHDSNDGEKSKGKFMDKVKDKLPFGKKE